MEKRKLKQVECVLESGLDKKNYVLDQTSFLFYIRGYTCTVGEIGDSLGTTIHKLENYVV